MIPKSGNRFPACAKPLVQFIVLHDASAGGARSEKNMLHKKSRSPGPVRGRTQAHIGLRLLLRAGDEPKVERLWPAAGEDLAEAQVQKQPGQGREGEAAFVRHVVLPRGERRTKPVEDVERRDRAGRR